MKMSTKNEFKKFDSEFKDLVKKEKLEITSIEDLMIENIENYKTRLKVHVEELINQEIDEKQLISKKNRNGKKMDTN